MIDANGGRGEDHGVYCIEGGRITLGVPDGHSECGGFWSARWELDGDELRFVDFDVQSTLLGDDVILPALNASHPWLRIGDAPVAASEASESPSTATASDESTVADAAFPEGVYRHELTVQELLDAGIDRGGTSSLAGTWELTFADGTMTSIDVNDATGVRTEFHSVYCVEGDRITVGAPNGSECARYWSAAWELDGDELRFVDFKVESTVLGDETVAPAIFASHPWLRISDAPSTTDATAVGVDTSPTES